MRVSSEIVDCGFPLTFDTYSKCRGGCVYCFSTGFKDVNPSTANKVQKLTYLSVKTIDNVLSGNIEAYANYIKDRIPIQWGGLTDPFMHEESKCRKSLDILKLICDYDYPVRICTKGLELRKPEYKNIINKNVDNFKFMISMTTLSDDRYKYIERNIPKPSERLEVIKDLSDLGCYTVLRFRPFIFGVSDKDYIELINAAAKSGASAISLEFLCYDKRSNLIRERFQKLKEKIGVDIEEFYSMNKGSSSTYQRLRKSIEAPIIREIYLECKKLGLNISISDPNFKELSDFGNCCASNGDYFKYQLTEELVKARKYVWNSKGFATYDFSFSNIYDGLRHYFGTIEAGSPFPIHFDRKDAYEHKYEMIPDYVMNNWNQPNKVNSIYRYLQGKVVPVGLNKNNDVVYRYIPSKWEIELRDEVRDICG